jgi:hypothetical protein
MKITVKKVKTILKEEYEWTSLGSDANKGLITVLIKDVITIVTKSLKDKK